MADEEMLRGLSPWQLAAFAAGCVHRVAPLVEAFGTATERWAWRDAQEALFGPRCPPAPEVCAELIGRLSVVQRDEGALATPPFLDAAARTLRHSLRGFLRYPDGAAGTALAAGWAADEVFESLDDRRDRRWADAELEAQRRTIAAVRRLPWPEAAPAIRETRADLTALVEKITASGRIEPAGPLPPRPVPRVRHPGHEGAAVPRPEQRPRTLVAAGERRFDRPSFRCGDVVRMSCDFADAEVLQLDEDGLGLRVPWHAGQGWYLPDDSPPGAWSPYRVEPPAGALEVGARCRAGIASQVVYVVEGYVFASTRRPEPQALMAVLPAGTAPLGGFRRYTNPVDPYLNPVEVVLEHRAYEFLDPGEAVVDATGAELVFHPPVLFLTPEGEAARSATRSWPAAVVPQWPLRRGDGTPVPETSEGCHDDELDGWERAAAVPLPGEQDLVPCFLRIGPVPPHISYQSL